VDDGDDDDDGGGDDKHRPLIHFLIVLYTSVSYPSQSQPGFCSV